MQITEKIATLWMVGSFQVVQESTFSKKKKREKNYVTDVILRAFFVGLSWWLMLHQPPKSSWCLTNQNKHVASHFLELC